MGFERCLALEEAEITHFLNYSRTQTRKCEAAYRFLDLEVSGGRIVNIKVACRSDILGLRKGLGQNSGDVVSPLGCDRLVG